MVYKAHPMERRKLLLHIDQEDDQDEVSSGSSVSRLLIECPRVVYTAFCFIIFLTSCLFLLILLVFLLLLNERSDSEMILSNKQNYQSPTTSTKPPPTITMYRNKQSMFEYLRGLKRNKNKTNSPAKQSKQRYLNKNKNLTETCLNLIRNDDEFVFNNVTINNIFFTKFSDEVLDEKFACCIESAAYLNPYKTVFTLNIDAAGNSDRVRRNVNTLSNDTKAATVTHINYLKSFYKNLKVRDINVESFLRNTPFENNERSRRDPKLLAKMTELITLWKYSGLINSKQNLLLSNLFYNQSTILLEKSVLYSSYSQICSWMLEKLLTSFKTRSGEPYDIVDQVTNSAIDSMINDCGQCDVKKLTPFEVCTKLKPSCFFVNIDSVWSSPNVNISTYCPKVYEMNSSKVKVNEKQPPVLISI